MFATHMLGHRTSQQRHAHQPPRQAPPKVRRGRKGHIAVVLLATAALVAPTAPLAMAAPDTTELWLDSGQMRVQVSRDFPQAEQYQLAGKPGTLGGNSTPITEMLINGEAQPVKATLDTSTTTTASYTLSFEKLAGVSMKASLTVERNQLSFKITEITDPDARVASLQIPGHNLVSVNSTQPGAQLSSVDISVNRAQSGDQFTPITAETPVQDQAQSSAYALVNTGELAAAVETNSLYDSDSGPDRRDSARVWHQITGAGAGAGAGAGTGTGDTRTVGLSSGAWLYRAPGAPNTEELPWTKVVVTADANGDNAVSWQDGAIALRDIMTRPYRGDETKKNVVTHIPFNFASQATHPFLRTLDDVKRIALSTDGLGQQALLKGYTSEGHDSANSDMGGNYNTRAGGLKDLNTLLSQGKEYNATFGVHVNATEAYPESNMFSEDLVDPKAKGWNWLDQSYYIKQREDANSGALAGRIKQLADETDNNLSFVYVDVFYKFGWLARNIQRELIANDFRVSSEWSDKLFPNNIWSHWANDENYGGSDNKGINSTILRFTNNTQQDVWNPDPLLGSTHIVEFEGWTQQNDWPGFYKNIWTNNVPTKFLQASELMSLTDTRAEFAGNVVSELRGGARVVTLDGREVQRGESYLLPWTDRDGAAVGDTKATKLYYYNPAGGPTTWEIPTSFLAAKGGKNAKLNVHKLTDQGRVSAGTVSVGNSTTKTGTLTLDLEAGQPYVLVPAKPGNGNAGRDALAPTLPTTTVWGAGTPVTDPGFNAGNLDAWNPAGTTSVEKDELGRTAAVLGAGESSIQQQLGALAPGTYSVSAYVEIEPGTTRPVTFAVTGAAADASVSVDRSTAKNYVGADERHGTYAQRLRVLIDVKNDGDRPVLKVSAGEGDSPVRIDDVRVVETSRVAAPDGATSPILAEDFENVDQGWGPFYKGDVGGSTDPRTHLAERNEPYTQKGWNSKTTDDVLAGDWSLKAHAERQASDGGPGMVYRTSDYSVKFEAGRKYRVSFDYQSSEANQYNWTLGYDSLAGGSKVVEATPIPQALDTSRWTQEFTAGSCGATWVGLQRAGGSQNADVMLDNLLIEDLGPQTGANVGCAQMSFDVGADKVEPGTTVDVTSSFTVDEAEPVSNVSVALELPEGWSAEALTPATADSMRAGDRLDTTWRIAVPADATGSYPVAAVATYTKANGEVVSVRNEQTITTYPEPPRGEAFASDIEWIGASNGWGPVERDQSNGETDEGDGAPLSLNGTTYAKGLGTHAPASVRYFLAGQCSSFSATVGLDDKQASRGSISFEVLGDGRSLASTDVLTPANRTADISADLSGVRVVELKVGDGGDGNGNDWADWANAKFSCNP